MVTLITIYKCRLRCSRTEELGVAGSINILQKKTESTQIIIIELPQQSDITSIGANVTEIKGKIPDDKTETLITPPQAVSNPF